MRIAIATIAIALAIALAGCGAQTIEGSLGTVVDWAQELPTDARANVTVTGRMESWSSEGDFIMVWLFDGGDSAWCYFDGPDAALEERLGSGHGRVTISGELDSERTSDGSITVRNCTLA